MSLAAEGFNNTNRTIDGFAILGGIAEDYILRADTERDRLAYIRSQHLLLLGGDLETERTFIHINVGTISFDCSFEEVHGRRTDEACNKLILRIVVQVKRSTDLLDDAELHDDYDVCHGQSFNLVVGDVDHRSLEAVVQGGNLCAHLDTKFCVEVGERFVKEEYLGLADDCAAYCNTLSLSTGEGLGLSVKQFFDLEDLGCFTYTLIDLFLGELADLLSMIFFPNRVICISSWTSLLSIF